MRLGWGPPENDASSPHELDQDQLKRSREMCIRDRHWKEWDYWQPRCVSEELWGWHMMFCSPYPDEIDWEKERAKTKPETIVNSLKAQEAKDLIKSYVADDIVIKTKSDVLSLSLIHISFRSRPPRTSRSRQGVPQRSEPEQVRPDRHLLQDSPRPNRGIR